jgi:hypothetical protein
MRAARGTASVMISKRFDFEPYELSREPGEPILLRIGPPAQVDDVLRLDVAELLEGLAERQRRGTIRGRPATGQEADSPRPGPLLRLDDERRDEEAEGHAGHEGPPIHHSIT